LSIAEDRLHLEHRLAILLGCRSARTGLRSWVDLQSSALQGRKHHLAQSRILVPSTIAKRFALNGAGVAKLAARFTTRTKPVQRLRRSPPGVIRVPTDPRRSN